MDKLKIIVSEIRLVNDDLNKLDDGCLLIEKSTGNQCVLKCELDKRFIVDLITGGIEVVRNNEYLIKTDYEIVGKQPMLNHVLHWLYCIGINVKINEMGLLTHAKDRLNYHTITKKEYPYFVMWKMTKPLLADQDISVINTLFDISRK